jgi:plasmid stability protein
MATITLKSLPEALHRSLLTRAACNHRSLDEEVIALLEQAVTPGVLLPSSPHPSRTGFAAEFRESLGFQTVPEQIERFKREGRQ